MWSVVNAPLWPRPRSNITTTGDAIWVKFPVAGEEGTSVVIWTTTPWTIPGNRAISYSSRIDYGLYEVAEAANEFGPQPGEKLIFADKLADEAAVRAKLTFKRVADVTAKELGAITCRHPLHEIGYDFPVPLLDGDHVTDDAGTGFVHTAPGHGADDFDIWMVNGRMLAERGIDTKIPFAVDDAGFIPATSAFGPDAEDGWPASSMTRARRATPAKGDPRADGGGQSLSGSAVQA